MSRANYVEVRSQTRARLAEKVVKALNEVGPDNVIGIIYDEGGKFAGPGNLLASMRAYVFYKE